MALGIFILFYFTLIYSEHLKYKLLTPYSVIPSQVPVMLWRAGGLKINGPVGVDRRWTSKTGLVQAADGVRGSLACAQNYKEPMASKLFAMKKRAPPLTNLQ